MDLKKIAQLYLKNALARSKEEGGYKVKRNKYTINYNKSYVMITDNNMKKILQIILLLSFSFLFSQWSFIFLKSTIEGLEQGVKCVKS